MKQIGLVLVVLATMGGGFVVPTGPVSAAGGNGHVNETIKHAKEAVKHAEEGLTHAEPVSQSGK